ncbi:phosphotransferase [Amycolatopsis alkalitolerans]|uniref:phosphotransferase n=1 Tax=Amycolatopsis alkalitolerans TaxID=2547244 RepID=UPI001F350156|nr:phosphotransferase [Amycolatopsis alkalitolerans]
MPSPEARRLGEEAGRVLKAIGTFEFARPGFFEDARLDPSWLPGELPDFIATCLETMAPGWNLDAAERKRLLARAERYAPLVAAVAGAARLVHSDYNPKNLLARREGRGWRITAVLDWEFAFSGCPLTDVGNMLRFGDTPFTDGLVDGAEPLPAGWRETARALADFLTRPPREPALRAVLSSAGEPPASAHRASGNRPGPA